MRIVYLIIIFIALLLAGFAQDGQAAQPVTLVFASGMAEINQPLESVGLPQLAALLKKTRAENDHVLFLHGGGALSPSILSSTDKGAHMIALLNLLEPDAMCLAKSEFAYKEDELTLRSFEAGFPLINSNIHDPLSGSSLEGIYPYQIFSAGLYTIGVMALVDPDVIVDYLPKRAVLTETSSALAKTTAALRAGGADMIILLADFRVPDIDRLLAGRIVDIALVSDPSLNPAPEQIKNNYYELNTQAGAVCLYSLNLEGHGDTFNWSGKATSVRLADFKADPAVTEKITTYLADLAKTLNSPVAITKTAIDTRRVSVRSSENGFGNLLADILREFYDSDFALVNGGGIRGNRMYPEGTTLTRGDIYRELPFNNKIINIKITGRQIMEGLENGLSRIEDGKGRFPHVSGMRVLYNPKNPSGRRVIDVSTPLGPLKPEQTYTLATLDYIASGGDGYVVFEDCARIVKVGGGRPLWEYIRNGIATLGEISPQIDGRMMVVTNQRSE